MAYNGKAFKKLHKLLCKLPEWINFDTNDDKLIFQALTQKQVREIRLHFKGTIWKKSYNKPCKWWEYTAKYKDINLQIYGVGESPKTCKAITEKRMVTQEVPATYHNIQVEREFIIGWDCGGKKK